MAKWYLQQDGGQVGPVPTQTIRDLVDQAKVDPQTQLVRREDSSAWIYIYQTNIMASNLLEKGGRSRLNRVTVDLKVKKPAAQPRGEQNEIRGGPTSRSQPTVEDEGRKLPVFKPASEFQKIEALRYSLFDNMAIFGPYTKDQLQHYLQNGFVSSRAIIWDTDEAPPFHVNKMIKVGGVRYESGSPYVGPASILKRGLAATIDFTIFAMIILVLGFVMAKPTNVIPVINLSFLGWAGSQFSGLIGLALVVVLGLKMEGKPGGQSIGKKLVGTRIRTYREPFNSVQTLLRNLIKYGAVLLLLINPPLGVVVSFLVFSGILITNGRGVHDYFGGTKVVT